MLPPVYCVGAGSGRADQEWSSLADVILAWALSPSSITGAGLPTPGLFKTLSMEGEPPTPGAPNDSSDTAWENLFNSDFHRCATWPVLCALNLNGTGQCT